MYIDFNISEISDTIECTNGADLAPEFLYSKIAKKIQRKMETKSIHDIYLESLIKLITRFKRFIIYTTTK